MEWSNVWLGMALTVLAGLSTGFGGLVVLLMRKTSGKVLSVSLGFSAGVMIYISFVELLMESRILLIGEIGEIGGSLLTVAAFFCGLLFAGLIDKMVPSYENPHESRRLEEMAPSYMAQHKMRLLRTGALTALIIAIHNFPEGMATFVSTVQNPALGVAVAAAIAIHNIPEGISVAVPVYCATNSRRKAFGWTILSGLGEPLGALLAYLILMPVLNDTVFGVLFAVVAGIMVYISFDELLPAAKQYGEHHLATYGLVAGMIVIAVSLIFI